MMNMQDVMRIRDIKLGWAIEAQLQQIVDGDADPYDLNPNALTRIRREFLPAMEDIAFEARDDELQASLDWLRTEINALLDEG